MCKITAFLSPNTGKRSKGTRSTTIEMSLIGAAKSVIGNLQTMPDQVTDLWVCLSTIEIIITLGSLPVKNVARHWPVERMWKSM